jgi:hypothetical protein
VIPVVYVTQATYGATESTAHKWNILYEVKDDQIYTWWMVIESSSTNGEKVPARMLVHQRSSQYLQEVRQSAKLR